MRILTIFHYMAKSQLYLAKLSIQNDSPSFGFVKLKIGPKMSSEGLSWRFYFYKIAFWYSVCVSLCIAQEPHGSTFPMSFKQCFVPLVWRILYQGFQVAWMQ